MTDTPKKPFNPTFIRCTPERRAAVAHMRDVLATARLTREAQDLQAHAQALADFYRVLVAYDAGCGEPFKNPTDPLAIAQIRDKKTLQQWHDWAEYHLTSREERLRLGFEVELTWHPLPPPNWK